MPTATTSATSPTPSLPFPIFRPSPQINRYLIYDIEHITYLRAHHAILGVLIGTLPQIPQQSVFLGLPLELQPEEVQVLVSEGVAYVVDDRKWHDGDFRAKCGQEKETIIANLRKEGVEIARGIGKLKQERTKEAMQVNKEKRAAELGQASTADESQLDDTEGADDSLFDRPASTLGVTSEEPNGWSLTPTTSTSRFSSELSHSTNRETVDSLPTGRSPYTYPLFAYLHARGYFLSPGLRFGCIFSVYPGDPLRFHSHFLANAYGWDEEIELLELVGGGRLGTGVKKGWLIGGLERQQGAESGGQAGYRGDGVRVFCLEWGGM